jgi:predicted nucleotidyltransferase
MMRSIDEEDEQSVRAWIRRALQERYGSRLLRLILAGSRAKGTNRPNSDWDVIAVVEGFNSIWPIGPVRLNDKIHAPDDNEVEVFEVSPADLSHPDALTNCLIREALAHNIDV